MSVDTGSFIPGDGSHRFHRSFQPLPKDVKIVTPYLRDEIHNGGIAITAFNNPANELSDVFLGIRKPSIQQAAQLAALEAVTVTRSHPQLLMLGQEFFNTYRLSRMMEYRHRIPRGGNTLFVGSGFTYP